MRTVRRQLAAVLVVLWGTVLPAQTPARDRPAPRLSGSSVIRGRVGSATTGAPLRHARVSLSAGTGTLPTVLSDGEGRFTFDSLRAAAYTISAVKSGFAKSTRKIEISDHDTVDAGDIALERGAVISGFVVDEAGEPIAVNIRFVQLQPRGDRFEARAAAFTDSDDLGAFRISGLGPGIYAVDLPEFVTRPGRNGEIMLSIRSAPPIRQVPEDQRIVVQSGEEKAGLIVTMPRDPFQANTPPAASNDAARTASDPKTSAVFRGTVSQSGGSALANATVSLFEPTSGRPLQATTNGRGEYEIVLPKVTPEADYRVTARKPGYTAAEYGQRRPNGRGMPLRASPGETLDHLNLSLARLSAIAGQV